MLQLSPDSPIAQNTYLTHFRMSQLIMIGGLTIKSGISLTRTENYYY